MPGRSAYVEAQSALRPARALRLQAPAEWLASVHVLTRTGDRLDAEGVPAVPLSLGHGDYWLRNVLLDGAGAVAAVLDWERARPGRPPTEDLFHLALTAVLAHRWPWSGRLPPPSAFERAFLRRGPVADEMAAALRTYGAAAGLEPRALRALFRLHLLTAAPQAGLAAEEGAGLAERLGRARWTVFDA
jgi:aminoglycoside phosphotransferase (APT) family kinase protein